ncbi:hypothetical protein FJZ19_03335 [Candidatus Pacearchaeota archaeon]|nr:hypothetical protein [Candidatus Pacearchaeota archaeon]
MSRENQPQDVKIAQLYNRQEGLDRQMHGVKVFDSREVSPILKTKTSRRTYERYKNKEEIWFLVGFSKDTPLFIPDWQIFIESEKPYVVSGLIPQGYFTYSCMESDDESDPQYVAIKSDEIGIDEAIKRIKGARGNEIIYGRELDIQKAIDFLKDFQAKAKAERIEEFLNLPVDEQRKRLESLL